MSYRPLATGIGIIAGYLAALLGLSFYARRRIGARLWRRAHRLTIVVWLLAAAPRADGGHRRVDAVDARDPRRLRGADRRPVRCSRGRAARGAGPPAVGAGGGGMSAPMVIVGGGLAGQRFAETLRRARVTTARCSMVCAEPTLPYDRPPLSKELLAGRARAGSLRLRDDAWYRDNDVELQPRRGAPSGSTRAPAARARRRLGASLRARCSIATGRAPRGTAAAARLRQRPDAARPRRTRSCSPSACAGRAGCVIVGGGFIGLEVASTARALGAEVAVVEAAPAPLAGPLGVEVGSWFARMHRRRGVTVLAGTRIAGVRGIASVRELRLDDGTRLPADVVLAAVGAAPRHALVRRRRSALPGVVAAGDVTGQQHWEAAVRGAGNAARALLGLAPAPAGPAGFWSDQHGVRFQLVGDTPAPIARRSTAIPTHATSASPTGAATGRGDAARRPPRRLPGARRTMQARRADLERTERSMTLDPHRRPLRVRAARRLRRRRAGDLRPRRRRRRGHRHRARRHDPGRGASMPVDRDHRGGSGDRRAGLPVDGRRGGRCHAHLRPGAPGDERRGVGERADGGAPPRPLGELRRPPRPSGPSSPPGRPVARSSSGVACAESRWPSTSTPLDVGEQQQDVRAQPLGEQRGGQVLVDDGLDAAQAAVAVAHDRHAAAARADHEHAGAHEQSRSTGSSTRSSGSGEPTTRRQPVAVGAHRPAALGGEAAARVGLVDRADRLRRARAAAGRRAPTIVWVSSVAIGRPGSAFISSCCEHVADRPLGLGAEHVERGTARDRGRGPPAARAARSAARCRA